ncbi:hypothetical protein AAMO2058_001319900 [Amorphochlora amoebiformis]
MDPIFLYSSSPLIVPASNKHIVVKSSHLDKQAEQLSNLRSMPCIEGSICLMARLSSLWWHELIYGIFRLHSVHTKKRSRSIISQHQTESLKH